MSGPRFYRCAKGMQGKQVVSGLCPLGIFYQKKQKKDSFFKKTIDIVNIINYYKLKYFS